MISVIVSANASATVLPGGNSTSITVTAPAHAAGPVDVTVTTGGGTSVKNSADAFSYSATAPVVTGLSQASGSTAGNYSLVIYGSHFTNATAVFFGGTRAIGYTVVNDTVISAVVPAMPAGTNRTVTIHPQL